MGKVSFGELVNSGATPLPTSEFIRPAREISFAEIICPEGGSIEESDFVKHFCAKQMLHIAQDDRTRFEHLLSWRTINQLLSQNLLDQKLLRVARDGRDLPQSLYRKDDGDIDAVDSRKLHDLLKQNASVALNAVQYYCPPVRRLATQMEVALGQRLNVNAYMTFGPGGAFAMHYDSHDVLVLQVHGSKHWFIYDDPAPSPIDYVAKAKPEPREVVFETVLQAGDVLYVPRGTYHRAAVTDTDSVHLTFGIQTFYGLKFIEWLLTEAEKEEIFRKDILTLSGPEVFAEQERAMKARLCEIINNTPLIENFERWRAKRRPVDRFHLGPREELDDYSLLAPLLRSPQAWRDSVVKKGKEPSAAGERIIDTLIAKNFATIGELKAELGDVLDEDTIKSTVAELIDDCWIELVHNFDGSGDG
ncbi:MAG TPA: cupin domain-containing protein [Sphingomicrobium sp.]|nr:cupin domain-containing protein [Sphingomicrobium sp.]